MKTDSDRIDELQDNLNVLVGVIAQTQQQMQTLVAGMQAMQAQLKAQQQELLELRQQTDQGQEDSKL